MLLRGLFREIDEGGKVVGGTRVHRLTEVTVGVWSKDYLDPRGRIGVIRRPYGESGACLASRM